MKIPFWEKAFKKEKSFLFGSQPNKTIVEFEEKHPGVPLHKHASNKLVARRIKK